MTNNTATTTTLDTTTKSYTIPKGYHSGSGKVQIVTQTKSQAASTENISVEPDDGKLLSSVTVKPQVHSAEYALKSSEITKDLTATHNIRHIDATNVYNKGKEDAIPASFEWGVSTSSSQVFSDNVFANIGLSTGLPAGIVKKIKFTSIYQNGGNPGTCYCNGTAVSVGTTLNIDYEAVGVNFGTNNVAGTISCSFAATVYTR